MAIEIPPRSVWGGKKSIVVRSMKETALDDWAWNVYSTLNVAQRMHFQRVLKRQDVVRIALIQSQNRPKVVRKKVAKVVTPLPARLRRDPTVQQFTAWMKTQSALVALHPGLTFGYGKLQQFRDGTISQKVFIKRKGVAVSYTDFVFHYHPGVKGPKAGHGYASKWHFKPYDGADKFNRMASWQFKDLNVVMVAQVKQRVRSYR